MIITIKNTTNGWGVGGGVGWGRDCTSNLESWSGGITTSEEEFKFYKFLTVAGWQLTRCLLCKHLWVFIMNHFSFLSSFSLPLHHHRRRHHHRRCHHHHHHQSLNRKGRWGTTDDFANSFFHFFLFSTALWDLPNSRPVDGDLSYDQKRLPVFLFLCCCFNLIFCV